MSRTLIPYFMDYEDSTISIFSQNALEYQSRQTYEFQDLERKRFMKSIHIGGMILDLGCGPGRDALVFQKSGFNVLAVDGAEGMIEIAKSNGLKTKLLKYSQLDMLNERFNGIWASYSLLHLPKKKLVGILYKIKQLLKPKGVLYASFRIGEGEEMRKDDRYSGGRYFVYYNNEEIKNLFSKVFKNISIGHVENIGLKGGVYVWVIND